MQAKQIQDIICFVESLECTTVFSFSFSLCNGYCV